MAARFPHHYQVRVEGGSGGAVISSPPRPEFRGGPPVEFDGRDDWWSPEHLLLSAAGLCLKTTFEALARRAGMAVIAYGSRVEGVLEKTPQGIAFTSVEVIADVMVGEEDAARAEQLMQSAKQHCIVANALKVPVGLTTSVKTVALAPA